MKIALISDIHANLPALVTVLLDIKSAGAAEIWHLGDLLGYGPFPNQVIEQIRRDNIQTIIGNYDRRVLDFPDKENAWKKEKDPAKFFSFEWTFRHLSDSSKTYLNSLPEQLRFERERKKFLLVHGSPVNMDEHVTEHTPVLRLTELAQGAQADVVLCGHTHQFFHLNVEGVTFINPGSVGRPFDGDPRTSYALIEIHDGKFFVENRRLDYDVAKTTRTMLEEGFPTDLVSSIALGRSIDSLKDDQSVQFAGNDVMEKVLQLARAYDYEQEHAHQVTRIALKLFDQLKPLHEMSMRDRMLLQSAALLHDIAWKDSRETHHKAARDIIIKSRSLPFTPEEKVMVGMTARYHRRSLPDDSHRYYCDLEPVHKIRVNQLAAILRLADGLDKGHSSWVEDLECRVEEKSVVIEVRTGEPVDWQEKAARKKADLFEKVFSREVVIKSVQLTEK